MAMYGFECFFFLSIYANTIKLIYDVLTDVQVIIGFPLLHNIKCTRYSLSIPHVTLSLISCIIYIYHLFNINMICVYCPYRAPWELVGRHPIRDPAYSTYVQQIRKSFLFQEYLLLGFKSDFWDFRTLLNVHIVPPYYYNRNDEILG